jgi:hypothetical protein
MVVLVVAVHEVVLGLIRLQHQLSGYTGERSGKQAA